MSSSPMVVLRSWSDGKPPVVTAIARDSGKNEIIVKPDRKGQFVTEEVPKKEARAGPPGLPQPPNAAAVKNNYNKFGLAQLKFWQKKDKYHTNSGGSSSSSSGSSGSHSGSPSPPYTRPVLGRTGSIDAATLGPYYFDENNMLVRNHFEKVSLSRESSVPSLTNSHSPIESTGSPPQSPSISRYKNLGPELAATIPKRLVIRKSWIRDGGDGDDDNGGGNGFGGGSDLLRKKEMSKSTPALNSIVGFYSSSSSFQQQQPAQPPAQLQHPHLYRSNNNTGLGLENTNDEAKELSCVVEDEESVVNNRGNLIVAETGSGNRSGLLLKKTTSTPVHSVRKSVPVVSAVPKSEPRKKRPLSYADSLFVDNEQLEPTFGDVPASVVGVIKKNSDSANPKSGVQSPPQLQSPPPVPPAQQQSREQQQFFAENVERIVSTTYETVQIDEANKRPKIIARQSSPTPKPQIEVSEAVDETEEELPEPPQTDRKNELRLESDLDSNEFTVHNVEHGSDRPRSPHVKGLPEDEEQWTSDNDNDKDEELEEESGTDLKSNENNLAMNLQYSNKERLIGGGVLTSYAKLLGNQRNPLSAEDLSSMMMFPHHASQSQPKHHQQQKNNLNKFTTTTTMSSKSYSHDEDEQNDRDQHHGRSGRSNGTTAYAQVPIQAVNQHVVVPDSFRRERQQQAQGQGIPSNLRHHQMQNSLLQQKNTQSRKNFCDDLLNDNITIKVPLPPRPPSPINMFHESPAAPSMTPPPVPPSVLPAPYQQPQQKVVNVPTTIKAETMPQQQAHQKPSIAGPNHDGIIFFDEEEEFDYKSSVMEDSELDEDTEVDEKSSVAMSEKENSFEYMSVSHNNVKAYSPDPSVRSHSPTLAKPGYGLPEIQKRIGLDIGSAYARFSTADPTFSSPAQIQDICRAIVTSDGQSHGYKSLSHSMGTKSKLIYKWRPANNQSTPSSLIYEDLYGGDFNEEEFCETLETLFKTYKKQFCSARDPKGIANGIGTIELVHKSTAVNSSSSASSTVSTISISPSPVHNTTASGVGSKTITQWSISIAPGMDKKLVREAAFNSGLVQPHDELRLVNEATAAAVSAYEHLKTAAKTSHYHRKKKMGRNFLSVNIGSTFIHSSGYEMLKEDLKIHVISEPRSHPYQSPETQFIELLSRLFSPEFILKYESRFTPGWIELLVRFDEMKNAFFKYDAKPFLFVPTSFYMEFYKFTGIQIPECLEENIEEGILWDNNGALHFNRELLNEWLSTPVMTFIKTKIDKSYDNIMLSGGNGVYDFVVKIFEKELPHVNVYRVPDPENAVVCGLVNLDQIKITFKSPFSIGCGVMTPFDPTKHPEEKRVTRSGKEWCSDVWDNLIRKGQILTVGEIILKRTYVGAQPGQNVLVLPLFKSYADEPKLVTSPSVEKCCELRFEIGKEKSWREVQLIIKCLESELSVIAVGKDGIISQMPIDF